MSFCSSCGAELAPGVRFCSNCGAAVSTTTAVSTYATPTVATTYGDYSLVLLSIGSCPQSQSDEVLQDLLGYTTLEAIELLTCIPTEIAQGLTQQQALYLAQAFTEYGMEIAVYCNGNYVDLGAQATTSVYASDGSILKNVLATLATVTIANRLSKFLRWTRPVPAHARFEPRHTPRPPVHTRRAIVRAPEPRRQPVPAHHPQAPHHVSQAPRPHGGHRGQGGPSIRSARKAGNRGPGNGAGHRGGHR